jgi:thiol-disulfide isomerase/thioredoxin
MEPFRNRLWPTMNVFRGIAVLMISFASLASAELPVTGRMPSLDSTTTWLNSPPLSSADLRGKVVLVDFWTYTCINWRRTLPWLRAWAQKYRDHGLVVIGVHTPEFSFERDLDNILREARAQDVTYPIAVDSGYAVWDAFRNQYWPALYFVDAQGRIRHHQFGEGNYGDLERVIQKLLVEAGQKSFERKFVTVNGQGAEAEADWDNLRSPETYLGSARSGSFASLRDVLPDRRRLFAFPMKLKLNEWALSGDWAMRDESSVSNTANGRIAYRFHARDIHLVMGPKTRGASIPFRVTVDGQPPGESHGVDIDASGRGLLDVQRMYHLIRQQGGIDDRQFEIEFLAPAAEVFVFTFG